MSTKYIAQVDGHTFKRVTAGRKYTHMVAIEWSVAADRVRFECRERDTYLGNLGYYTQIANATDGKYHGTFNDGKTWERELESAEIEEAKAYVAGGIENFVKGRLAEFDDSMSRRWLSPSGKTYWTDAGWCGRLDLAQKLAAKYRTDVCVASIQILETTVVTGTVKAKVAPKAHHRSI